MMLSRIGRLASPLPCPTTAFEVFAMAACVRTAFVCLLLGSLSPSLLRAEEVGPKVSLFNGRDLNGWHAVHCEAAVEDGALVITGGDGLLRADHRFADFVLELDWRPRNMEKYDSGIYFRCEEPAEGKKYPDKYQINLKQGDEGNLIGFPEARSKGLVKAGEWNHFKLKVQGDTAALEINGQPAWKTAGIEKKEGYLGFQVEVPLGGQYEFKNITIQELGYRPLFNGQDLTGWEGADQDASVCWKVEDGLLMCTGKKGPWLRTNKQFGDFNLRLEYKLKPAGNSGVYVRVPKGGAHHGKNAGVEVQVLDDSAPKYTSLKPYQYSGSIYAIVPAEPRVCRAPGEWNSMEIDCKASRYRIIHNGVVVIDADETKYPELAERLREGYLGLQNHSEEVWYRNVRVGPAVE